MVLVVASFVLLYGRALAAAAPAVIGPHHRGPQPPYIFLIQPPLSQPLSYEAQANAITYKKSSEKPSVCTLES